jgi:hypothetical protein
MSASVALEGQQWVEAVWKRYEQRLAASRGVPMREFDVAKWGCSELCPHESNQKLRSKDIERPL